MAKNPTHICLHCRAAVPDSSPKSGESVFCCSGCRAAHALITEAGLTRYYDLQSGSGTPGELDHHPMGWLEPLIESARACSPDPHRITVTVDVQGLHCAGCVWLLQALFKRRPGAFHLDVNPGLGRLSATFDPDRLDLSAYLADLGQVGYRAGPPVRDPHAASDGLGLRLGVTFAIAMNAMALSLAGYFGLDPDDPGGLFNLFGWVNLGLAVAAFSVGAPVFIRGAVFALKRKTFHLDLPIAIGLVLAFTGSVALFFSGEPERAYFDTLDLFIALMLLGRWAQRRLLESNRRLLLEDDGFESARIKCVASDGTLEHRPLHAIKAGTRFLVAPGELLPVAARISDNKGAADFSLAWVTGESDPVAHPQASAIVAGAHLLGPAARIVEALEPFATSGLHDLLRRPAPVTDDARPDAFWHRVTTAYVLVVLVAAAAACLAWLIKDPSRALDVTTAVLVVTCPCAIGLATPLAYELANNRLRKKGLHSRRPGLLDRARRIRTVIFDKTGTLTLGDLAVENPEALDALSNHDRDALSQMVQRSNHPKSKALAVAVPPAPLGDAHVEEVTGVGLTLREPTRILRLEATPDGRHLTFTEQRLDTSSAKHLDHREIARFTFREVMRSDARAEVRRLQSFGIAVHLASGDSADRADQVAADLGIPKAHVHARLTPTDKESLVRRLEAALPGSTLMLGDGVNDALAFEAASLAGTPAIDRPTLPARADFFLTTRGVGPISDLLLESARVRRITLRNLAIAFTYNAIGLTAALAGVLSPIVCAIAMPLSSLIVLALTIGSQRRETTCPLPTLEAAT